MSVSPPSGMSISREPFVLRKVESVITVLRQRDLNSCPTRASRKVEPRTVTVQSPLR